MNKQQVAKKIWASATEMRGKIEANEYKDYILGMMFYKYLSENELEFLKKEGMSDEDFKDLLKEENRDVVEHVQNNIGYFISYENLFSTWKDDEGYDFSIGNVRTAMSAFDRLIKDNEAGRGRSPYRKVFGGIMRTLETGLGKLGESAQAQTKAIRGIMDEVDEIPMNGRQDYDVLGFIYEYLIGQFAANAGKKAGEFYTPYEVSVLMSEIIANHLKDRETISIYDGCSGSGSLLINIGKAVSKYMEQENAVKYYAQELKENTYNLTRMNLIMRGVIPENIEARNADTLEDDWPIFKDDDPLKYETLRVDAVTSNPPYSQKWDPKGKESDPRYAEYGLAPKSKADYAFLLHDLYHVKPDGIMTIVLPHGVLFRGGEEGAIRKALIENNYIDTIIGLPAGIFFGTGIPTIIMVLKRQKDNTDVLFVDASKGFVKEGKNNRLRARDIKKIVDTVVGRVSVEKFSRVVSKETIVEQDYNLNIPRYVDASEAAEYWDIYASMFGGIPQAELDVLCDYWSAFPSLKEELFEEKNDAYVQLRDEDIESATMNNADIKKFIDSYNEKFIDFSDYLENLLIENAEQVNIQGVKDEISQNIFDRLTDLPIIDKYSVYQFFDDSWGSTSEDLEVIQTEGFSATKQVDERKKLNSKNEEVSDGWQGHIIPFELVQETLLAEEYNAIIECQEHLSELQGQISDLVDALPEEEKEKPFLNDDNTAFVAADLKKEVKAIREEIETDEIAALKEYIEFLNTDPKPKKNEKIKYVEEHTDISWDKMESSNGVYASSKAKARIKELRSSYVFEEGSVESILIKAAALIEEESLTKKDIKEKELCLHEHTKEAIEALSDEQAKDLLNRKWILPLLQSIKTYPEELLSAFIKTVIDMSEKYKETFEQVEASITETEKELSGMLCKLTGNGHDMQGINELKILIGGDNNE